MIQTCDKLDDHLMDIFNFFSPFKEKNKSLKSSLELSSRLGWSLIMGHLGSMNYMNVETNSTTSWVTPFSFSFSWIHKNKIRI